MRFTEKSFSFGLEIVKSEQDEHGDWTFEGLASLPGRDLQHEEIVPQGLEIDYLLGKGLPPGQGGYVNYDHDPAQIVGIPLEGRITPQGFWLKWKALKTKFMTEKVIPAIMAMKEAGWPRRYGMSIEGVVKETDPRDPSRITRAFVRNVALTPTPVHPGTFVDFAKSLTADTIIEYRPAVDPKRSAIATWVQDVVDIRRGRRPVQARNPYFTQSGQFKRDGDVRYFSRVHLLPEPDAVWCGRYALSRERVLAKSIDQLHARSRGHPLQTVLEHLRDWKRRHPDCPHLGVDGRIQGGLHTAARHFYGCERRSGPEVNAILDLLSHSEEES